MFAQAFLYSRENNVQSVGFCENRSVALTKSKLTEVLHSVYVEAEVISPEHSVNHGLSPPEVLLQSAGIISNSSNNN